jgi:peroxiredoxin
MTRRALALGVAFGLLAGVGRAQDPPPPDEAPPTPAEARVARQLGENLWREGQYEAALREWQKVLRGDPTDAVAWYFEGACHARLRHHAEAIVGFDRALALRPGWTPALSARAGSALLAGDFAAAQRGLEAAIAAARNAGQAADPRDVQLLEQAVECQAGAKRAVVGEAAPTVRCRDTAERSVALADLVPEARPPKAVVLLFHGGLRSRHDVGELARLREHLARLTATGAVLYGVSRDTPIENRILAEEKGLPFPLLSDTEGATTAAYGMVDLRLPGEEPGTLLGVAILDGAGTLRHRALWLDPEATLDWKALAVIAGKITGTPPPEDPPAEPPAAPPGGTKESTPR